LKSVYFIEITTRFSNWYAQVLHIEIVLLYNQDIPVKSFTGKSWLCFAKTYKKPNQDNVKR